jgi:hypothetical protein
MEQAVCQRVFLGANGHLGGFRVIFLLISMTKDEQAWPTVAIFYGWTGSRSAPRLAIVKRA